MAVSNTNSGFDRILDGSVIMLMLSGGAANDSITASLGGPRSDSFYAPYWVDFDDPTPHFSPFNTTPCLWGVDPRTGVSSVHVQQVFDTQSDLDFAIGPAAARLSTDGQSTWGPWTPLCGYSSRGADEPWHMSDPTTLRLVHPGTGGWCVFDNSRVGQSGATWTLTLVEKHRTLWGAATSGKYEIGKKTAWQYAAVYRCFYLMPMVVDYDFDVKVWTDTPSSGDIELSFGTSFATTTLIPNQWTAPDGVSFATYYGEGNAATVPIRTNQTQVDATASTQVPPSVYVWVKRSWPSPNDQTIAETLPLNWTVSDAWHFYDRGTYGP